MIPIRAKIPSKLDYDAVRRLSAAGRLEIDSNLSDVKPFPIEVRGRIRLDGVHPTGAELRQDVQRFASMLDPNGMKSMSIVDMYHEMPSPELCLSMENFSDKDRALISRVLDMDSNPAFKTVLYDYQKTSLYAILRKELGESTSILCPSTLELFDAENKPFYFSLETLLFSRIPTYRAMSRGGIICEEMGYGKTFLCLSLVYLTKSNFNGARFMKSETKLKWKCDEASGEAVIGPPSLVNRTLQDMITESFDRTFLDTLPDSLKDAVMENVPYYYWYPHAFMKSARLRNDAVKVKIYVSTATLVIVPDNLVSQWISEIDKHFQASALCVVVNPLPESDPSELGLVDVVLVSYQYVARQKLNLKESILPPTEIPFLKRIHWKRIIVDEGHVMSSTGTNVAIVASDLWCDFRWVCTGTPTKNLVAIQHRVDKEQDDLLRLGHLMGGFLKQEPFNRPGQDYWRQWIVKPFRRKERLVGSLLRRLFVMFMVRNDPNEIQDVQIPPLHESITFLDFTMDQRITYNTLVSFFYANAILTQQRDQDYLFHEQNRAHLSRLVRNLNASCFWFSPNELEYMELSLSELTRVGHKRAQNEMEHHNVDIAIRHLKRSFENTEWRAKVFNRDPRFFVHGLEFDLAARVLEATEVPGHPYPTVSTVNIVKASLIYYARDYFNKMATLLDETKPPPKKKIRQSQEQIATYKSLQLGFPYYARASVVSTNCAKLDYLIRRCQKHRDDDEKTIIFFENGNDAFYLSESFYMTNISALLIHGRNMPSSVREQNFNTFRTSNTVHVMIIKTTLAAFGLDLSCASRIYFVSPVYRKDLERQAIKRAHRIGQTRPVFVETLVIRGSIEEKVLDRRMQSSTDTVSDPWITDTYFRSILRNLEYIDDGINENVVVTLDVCNPLFPLLSARPTHADEEVDILGFDDAGETLSVKPFAQVVPPQTSTNPPRMKHPNKKRSLSNMVRFADNPSP